jgi:putative transposase
MPDMDVLAAILLAVALALAWKSWRRPPRNLRAVRKPAAHALLPSPRCRRKPDWVIREVLRMKALCPELGLRKLEDAFNRRFAVQRSMTVCKSTIANILRRHHAELLRLRRDIKHRVPRPMPRNRIWGLDLTGNTDASGHPRLILGLLDHGSRACLQLSALADKSSLGILRELIDAFRRFGLPKIVRTDNEACFTSVTLRLALAALGVRLQHIQLHCPWQNGRVERLFGTLKPAIRQLAIADGDDLACRLVEFRAWYNHVRPHQHLGGMTPAEVWERRGKSRRPPIFFSAWDGVLRGWYFPP